MRTPYKRCNSRYLADIKPLSSRKPLLAVALISLFLLGTPLAPIALTYGIFYVFHLLCWDFINCYDSAPHQRPFDPERVKGKEEYEKITSLAPLLPVVAIFTLIFALFFLEP